jgi:tRNA A-37 threonylcarbamoyl transferase component Bud32
VSCNNATGRSAEQSRVAIIRLIDKLHNAGFVHGDVDLRHVRRQRSESCSVQGDDHWRLIDFERAFTADVESITHERKHLCDLLGVDGSVEL